MADLADILGVDKSDRDSVKESKPKKAHKKDPYANLPRYLRDIVDENNPPPADLFQHKKSLVISKEPAQKWIYAEFTNSARDDKLKLRHWVRKGVEYPDYPFARFNIKVDVITYTQDEYDDCIFDVPQNWTKELTDELFELCRRYDLRWPIIMDKFSAKQYSIEECQMVYLDVTKTVLECRRRRGQQLTDSEEQLLMFKFDPENSVKRRKQQDLLFRASGVGQQEDKQLQAKLKSIKSKLALIGSPDNRRSYGPRIPVEQMNKIIKDVQQNKIPIVTSPGVFLASQSCREEVELARDMREEYNQILNELGVLSLRNLSYKARCELLFLKRELATLLLAKKCKAENGLCTIPDTPVKRWTTNETKSSSKRRKTK